MMKRLERCGIAAILLTLCNLQSYLPGQTTPKVAAAPEMVPYVPIHSKLGPIQPCSDFSASPEKDVIYRTEVGISPPVETRVVTVVLTEKGKEAYRKNLFQDPNDVTSKISVVVGPKGKPTAPCLERAAGFDLDQQAAEAVMQYRFKPALKDGKPIWMRIHLEVRYQTH